MCARTIDLGREQVAALEDAAGTRLRVLHGNVWLTEEGRPHDMFIRDGEERVLRSGRRALIEGIRPARVLVMASDHPARKRTLRRLSRMLTGW